MAIEQEEDKDIIFTESMDENGNVDLILDEEQEKDGREAKDDSFSANLAETADEMELARLANDMLQAIREDEQARKKRDEQYMEALKKTGMTDEKAGGADFEGASRVYSPIIMQACVDYQSRTTRELLPPDGPARMKILGRVTKEKIERAERERDWLNLQATDIQSEYKKVLEKVLSQVPLSGSVYTKHLWNFQNNTFKIEPVYIDDMILPFHATSFLESRRKSQRMYLSKDELQTRMDTGLYRHIDEEKLAASGMLNLSESDAFNNKIEGKTETRNTDNVRNVYECHWRMKLDFDELAGGEERPYIITIDSIGNTVLSIYRNWDEDDEYANEIQWFVEYPYFPWRGVYAASIYHMISGLVISATGALRALLDAAHINNVPAGLKLRGNKFTGQSLRLDPCSITEIDAGSAIDTDIRKIFMPLPFNPPSQVLLQLLGLVTDQAQQVVATSEEKIADVGNEAPVGTALALIEQGSKTYASIFGRAHDAQAQSLAIIYRLNKKYLDRERVKKQYGEDLLRDGDFTGVCTVMPVSDPNIFAETQRYAQLQAVLQLANQAQDVFKRRELFKRALTLLRFPAPDEVLADDPAPKITNAASENVSMALGRPATAFIEQDQMAHIHAHLDFAKSSFVRDNQLLARAALPLLQGHISEHIAYAYNQLIYDKSNELLRLATNNPKADISDTLKIKEEEVIKESDRYIADVSAIVSREIGQMFAPIMQDLMELQQLTQTLVPPPQPTPELLIAQAQMKESDRKTAADQSKFQIDIQKLQAEIQQKMAELQIKQGELQRNTARDAQDKEVAQAKLLFNQSEEANRQETELARIQADITKNEQDNLTAIEIAQQRGQQQGGQIKSGEYLTNPNPSA